VPHPTLGTVEVTREPNETIRATMDQKHARARHRWRDYRTAAGRRPVAEFIAGLPAEDAAEVVAAMKDVAVDGLTVARHLRGDIWEVRASPIASSDSLSADSRTGDRVRDERRPGDIVAAISHMRYPQGIMSKVRARDFLDELIKARSGQDPRFPALVEAALERRKLLRDLAANREAAGISQTLVAAKMGTSQSAVARIESGEADVRMSTVERYAAAVGAKIAWSISPQTARARPAAATGRARRASGRKKSPK